MSDLTDMIDNDQAARQATRVVGELAREADQPLSVDIDPDRTRETATAGFSRMRTEWRPGEAAEVAGVMQQAQGIIHRAFPGVYLIMNELWMTVREPVVDEASGEIQTDIFGWPLWKKLPSGAYIEDYSRLTDREKDDFLLRITTGLLEWHQQAANLWGESMLAKGRWEEAMGVGFISPTGRVTVEERTQRGRVYAAEDRYHAIFRSAVNRSAEALVRSMELIGQRLKDSLTA
ncbi:hypothetical protein FNV58_00795 (plasmid) [Streptomyces sp. RLB1-9]|uniref:hypothetical protein n=1 Tax=Streptomyces sp. RLB1-9 TaxID=2594454 RepID=UPI0011637B50|nr:hypothetical protein [Streptomyces sp. RLB1-9]QDN94898.1 hypothetical protein FNV58_00795 [Streptomyces sp. RLB1-9]